MQSFSVICQKLYYLYDAEWVGESGATSSGLQQLDKSQPI
jgi:hypothetical protein